MRVALGDAHEPSAFFLICSSCSPPFQKRTSRFTNSRFATKMSEPKDLDAQNLDLGALDDALGGLDDGVAKQEGQAGSSHKAGGQKAQTKPEEQGAYSLDDGKGSVAIAKSSESPHTLSPSSLRSASPNPVPVTADATQAADADTTSKIKAIRGMFPSLDEETVGAVLAAEGGNEENGKSSCSEILQSRTLVSRTSCPSFACVISHQRLAVNVRPFCSTGIWA